jgi:biopolymer transport protein TolR
MAMSGTGTRGTRGRAVMNEINVTPLVDVMLVLLIIFMVTTPMMQQGIDIELPETAASGTAPAEEPFVITVQKNKRVQIAGQTVAISDLEKKLTAIFAGKKNKQVYLQADRSVDYGYVAETMALIRAAGITNIGLVTVPKGTAASSDANSSGRAK